MLQWFAILEFLSKYRHRDSWNYATLLQVNLPFDAFCSFSAHSPNCWRYKNWTLKGPISRATTRLRGSWPSLICHGARWCSRTASGSDRRATVFLNQSVFFLNSNPYTDYPLSILVEEPPSCFVDFLLVEFQWFFIQKLDSHLKKNAVCFKLC
jgi:hypothetical protein